MSKKDDLISRFDLNKVDLEKLKIRNQERNKRKRPMHQWVIAAIETLDPRNIGTLHLYITLLEQTQIPNADVEDFVRRLNTLENPCPGDSIFDIRIQHILKELIEGCKK